MVVEGQLTYLYCVADREPKIREIEGPENNLYSICHNSLYAVAAKVEESKFSEEGLKKNMADLEWVKTNATLHERIIEQIMTNTCVIPFKFGTLFNTDDSLKAMLNEYGEEFKAILGRLENKEEWGVKIYCDTEKLKAFSINDEPEILKIENEINSCSPGKAFFLKRGKTELLAQVVNRKINESGQESFDLLKELSFEARINKLLPKEVTERDDEMILNSAFLVSEDEVSDFINMVDALKVHYENKGFFIDCTGPWPPYNFCGLSKQKVQNV